MKFWNHIKWPGLAGAVLLALLLTSQGSIFRLGLSSVIPPGVVSPSSLVITLDEVDLAEVINGPFRVRVLPNPISLDVIKNTGQASNIFGSGGVLPTTYNGIRFVLNWKGTYAGINPCTGDVATDVDNQFQMPDADLVNHQRVEQLQVAHPVTGLQSGATGQIDAIHVGSDPVTLKLIVPASNSLGCVSDTPPSQEISGTDTGMASPFGVFVANNEIFISNNNSKANSVVVFNRSDSGNVTPQRRIQGPNTGLDTPGGIFVDTVHNELDVANFGNDSITTYDLSSDPTVSDLTPTRVISGVTAGIRGPGGVYVDTVNNELYVTNGPDDSITVYNRTADSTIGNVSPLRIIQGPTTGLNTPCGIFVDSTEIAVVNNGNDSITFYNRLDDSTNGNVFPLRTIKGDKTEISNACGLLVDTSNREVAVTSAGFNSINFFSLDSGLAGDENVYPIRKISGANSALSQPVAMFLDGDGTGTTDKLVVANLGNDSISMYNVTDPNCTNKYCASPHLLHHPVFINPRVQQQLLISYIYQGQILRSTGEPMPPTDPSSGQPYTIDPITKEALNNVDPNTLARLPIPLPQGYAYVFKVYDPTMHAAADVNSAYLIPPSNMQFQLGDGSLASNLQIGCAVFTPFTTDELTTNCRSQSLIVSPFPPQPVKFQITANVIGKVENKPFVPNIAPLAKSELPLVLPNFILGPTGAILDISWSYVNDSGQQLAQPPLIASQSFQITYSKPYSDISSCYKKRVKDTLAFSSGGMSSDVRTRSDIKDTGCDIFIKDVSNVTFSVLDAYENRYVYSWDVVD